MNLLKHLLLPVAGLLIVTALIVHLLPNQREIPENSPPREARAVWLHRFEYTRVTPKYNQNSIRQFVADVIDSAAASNFNMIIFQVRGNGDAYYTPGLEPWGELLTGKLGKNPGWDPLQFAINRAHAHGMELHAWINVFPAWRGKSLPPRTEPLAAILKHPEWLVTDFLGKPMPRSDGYISFSPGIPAVQDYIIKVASDITSRYDIDGMHLDYIRYPAHAPGRGYSHDKISVQRFHSETGNPLRLNWDDWQRAQLNHFVSRLYDSLKTIKPYLKISAAVLGSYNTGAWNAYSGVYQDPRRWTKLGKIDFLTPMTYYEMENSEHPFRQRVDEWQTKYSSGRYIFPGIGSYRFQGGDTGFAWTETGKEIESLRKMDVPGMVFFDATSLNHHWRELRSDYFQSKANLPPMPWVDAVKPEPPQNFKAWLSNDTIHLSWERPASDSPSDSICAYYLYASPTAPVDALDPKQMVAWLPGDSLSYHFIPDGKIETDWFFAISAFDRARNESQLSPSRWPVRNQISPSGETTLLDQ